MTTVVLTPEAFQETFNALLTRQRDLARELRFPEDLKPHELVELKKAQEGTQSALDSMQHALSMEAGSGQAIGGSGRL